MRMDPDSPTKAAPMTASGAPSRYWALDMARGIAMLFVFLAHYSQIYFVETTAWAQLFHSYGVMTGRIAAPAFVLVSGFLLGFLYQNRSGDWGAVRIHLIDKAIFMATVGHLLIALFVAAKTTTALWQRHITDTIAFCVLLGTLVVPRTTPLMRLALAGALYGMSWIAWLFWDPTISIGTFLKGVFIGAQTEDASIFWFPLMPWGSLYLAGSGLGGYAGAQNAKELHTSVAVRLIKIGVGAVALSMVIRVIDQFLEHSLSPRPHAMLHASASLYQIYPPSPSYLLLYSGISVMMIGGLYLVERAWRGQPVAQVLEDLGQSSLIAYVLQFLVYYTAIFLLVTKTDLAPTGLWPVYFLTSVALLLLLVRMSRRVGLNSLCTVGLPFLLQHRAQLKMPMLTLVPPMSPSGRTGGERRRIPRDEF
ncbi:MAG: acyltransferase family protein [Nitrospiraceae bacterium]